MGYFDYDKMTKWSDFQGPWDKLLKLFGYNVYEDNFSEKKRKAMRTFILIFPFHYLLSSVIFCFDVNWEINKSAESLTYGFIAIVIGVQLATLYIGQGTLIKVDKSIRVIWDENRNNAEEKEILLERAKEGHKNVSVLFLLSVSTIFALDTKCFVLREDRALPVIFPAYFLRSLEGIYYPLNLIYHNLGMMLVAAILVPFHSIYVNNVMQLVAQMQIVGLNIRRIKQNLDNPSKISELLRLCYFQHLNMIESSQTISKLFKYFFMAELNSATVVLSMTMFIWINWNSNIITIVNAMFLFASCTIHIFIFCWFGEKLITENDRLAVTIYDCPWYNLETTNKRVLQMYMTRLQIPIKITVFGFYDVGLPTLTEVMKTAYSLCAVLSTLGY